MLIELAIYAFVATFVASSVMCCLRAVSAPPTRTPTNEPLPRPWIELKGHPLPFRKNRQASAAVVSFSLAKSGHIAANATLSLRIRHP
jgi:hypothetical protein